MPCFIWGGGAIYHMLNGNLDYRKMSDIEFMLPNMDNLDEQPKFTIISHYFLERIISYQRKNN